MYTFICRASFFRVGVFGVLVWCGGRCCLGVAGVFVFMFRGVCWCVVGVLGLFFEFYFNRCLISYMNYFS